jgi:hypothetical protein
MPKPQSLRQGWTVHEAQGQASRQASDEAQEGLLIRAQGWRKDHR